MLPTSLATLDFSGRTIYAGIDVHKKTYAITCLCDGEIIKRVTLAATPALLSQFLLKHFPDAKLITAYEAGFSGFALHRHLVNCGIQNYVVHAAAIEVSSRDRVKTDKRDSMKIAVQLAAKRLHSIRIPTEREEQRRLITRTREQLIKDRVRIGNRIKSKLFQFGLLGPEDKQTITFNFIQELLKRGFPLELNSSLFSLAAVWLSLDTQIRRLNVQMEQQGLSDEATEDVYRSVPGMGPVIARTLANELGDLSQFSNERQLFSFIGLTPSEYSSGEHRRQGAITRQGHARLRHVLVEAAWLAIKKDPALTRMFDQLAKRVGKKRAIIAIARKLIGRIRACFTQRVRYQLNYQAA